MSRAILLALSLFLVAFAGCFGGGDADDDANDDDDNGDNGDQDRGFIDVPVRGMTVTMDEWPQNASVGAQMNFSWSADPGSSVGGDASSDNGTTSANVSTDPGEVPLNETGIAWGFSSVFEPGNVTDYNESQVVEEDTEAPGQWNATILLESNGTGGNGTDNETTLYVRAYAIDSNGTTHWSSEVEVEVERPEGDELTVEIGGSPGGFLSTYSPAEIVIEVGDSVAWTNSDSLGMTHTATWREGPVEFDTGGIAPDETSEPIVFDTPGTYTYGCDNHGTMDEATIIVNERNTTA